ncbi:MAG: DNA adenine methylase [Deltaproteobacteria bacterium]|nr:DNA adenine methylase [Deltaproteobacteria bacterium]
MVKSPLRYPGEKSRAVKIIAPLILRFDEFREPFLCGGSIFIYMKQKYPNKKYRINDIYSDLYYFWKHTQQNPGILIKLIQKYKDEFKNGNLHKNFDHETFAKKLRDISHKWLITYDNSEYIKKLFSFAYIKEWNLTYGMRNVKKNGDQNGKELFISNYPIIDRNKKLFPEY